MPFIGIPASSCFGYLPPRCAELVILRTEKRTPKTMILTQKNKGSSKNYSRKRVATTHKQADSPSIGDFCIVAKESGRISSRQIETLRRFLRRKLKKQART
jgi:hypothetical protein